MKIKLIVKKIQKLISIDNKYDISLISSSLSFYIIVAIFSLSSLTIQIYNTLFTQTNNFIINYFDEILNPYYQEHFASLISVLSLNSFSAVLIVSLFWSSSRLIDCYNKAADIIYVEYKKRYGLLSRINSFFMFLMIFCILIFEIALAVATTNWIQSHVNNFILFRIIQSIIEFAVIFLVVLILNMYVPPIPMTVKKSIIGAIITTFALYLISIIVLLIIKIYQHFNPNFGIVSVISMLFIWIFLINYAIIGGVLINYAINKKRMLKS